MKQQLKKKSLKINTQDKIKVYDRNGVYKKWFNEIKYFALRISPPYK